MSAEHDDGCDGVGKSFPSCFCCAILNSLKAFKFLRGTVMRPSREDPKEKVSALKSSERISKCSSVYFYRKVLKNSEKSRETLTINLRLE